MVLVQIQINTSNNGSLIAVPITGKACVRVLNAQYFDTATQATRIIQIQSDNLYFPYSPLRNLTLFCPKSSGTCGSLNYDVSRAEYHIKDQVFNGQLYVNVAQTYSSDGSGLPVSFYVLLTLDFEQIDKEFQ